MGCERFEDTRFNPKKGMVTKEAVEADVEDSIIEDYNYDYGCTYKNLKKKLLTIKKEEVKVQKALDELKYEPPL
jgi:hypothetical protein